MHHLQQSFTVQFNYQVFFTGGLFEPGNTLLSSFLSTVKSNAQRKIFFIVDSGVADAHPQLIQDIKNYFAIHKEVKLVEHILIVAGGERSKMTSAILTRFWQP
jgi:3-dehydroquinate synthase